MATYQDALGKLVGQATNSAINPIGNAQQNGGLAILQALLQASPIASSARAIGTIMGTESGANPFPEMVKNEQNAMSSAKNMVLSPFQEGVSKGLKKLGEAQATEAVMNGVPPKHIEEQAGLSLTNYAPMSGRMGAMNISGNPISPMILSQPQQDNGLNVLKQIMNFISTPSSVSPNGSYVPGTSLGGLIQEANDSVLAGQQAANLRPDAQISIEKRKANEVPLGLAEREKIRLNTQAELYKEALKLEKDGMLKPFDILTKFEDASKSFIETRDGYARMQEAYKVAGSNPAADLDLLYGTAKTLDPSGRVTDSDVAIQQSITGAYGDRVKRIAQKISRGGVLLPEERKALFEMATRRFKASEAQQKKTTDQFSQLAQRNGIRPENVIRDTGIQQSEPYKPNLPYRSSAPSGAKGWDTEKGTWVY